jgi:nicotinamidase-related amidase
MPKVPKWDVLVALSTQRAYLDAGSADRCTNADIIVPNIRRLTALARWSRLPLVTCVDDRSLRPAGNGSAPGNGSRIPPLEHLPTFMRLADSTVVESDNCLCIALDILSRHRHVVFTKSHRDPFTNPKFDRLMTEMRARRFVLFGLPLESSIRLLALGLLRRGRSVVVVHDACGFWDCDEAMMVARQLEVKGCKLASTEELVRFERRRLGHRVRLGRRSVA